MMGLLRASILTATFSLLFFLGASTHVAFAAEPTNDILFSQANFQAWATECKQLAVDQNKGSCIVTKETTIKEPPVADTVTTECRGEIAHPGNDWYCTFTSKDKSKIVHDPNNFDDGAIDVNYNSAGTDVGRVKTNGNGTVIVNTGTLTDNTTTIDSNGQGCGVDFLCALGKLPGILLSGIAYAILVLSTIVLFLAGTVFNWVVIRTVFQFATYFGTSEGMIVAWSVLRDIANIGLLFGFVFIGIATILNTQSVEGYSAKKALPRLIIFAVLLNFSLFATQGIIDVANGFASIFSTYAGEECGQANADGSAGQSNEECANIGISAKIISAAGMNNLFSTKGFDGALEKPYSTAAMLIILAILVSITAMVLFAASIMLVIRVVILSLLMVTSPIGFAGLAIPSLNKIAQDWWHRLINQAFFAPLYLLMVFVSLKLLDGLQTGGASIPQALTADVSNGGTIAGNMQVVVVYAIVIGFMVGSLMVAQKMGASGASFATKTAGGLAFGAQGFVARRTVGRMSALAAQSKTLSNFAVKNPGLGRLAYAGLNKGAEASFSARNLMGSAMAGAGAKLDIGKANATAGHGYHGIEKKAEDERLAFAKKIIATPETTKERDARVADEESKLRAVSESNAQKVLAAEAEVTAVKDKKTAAQENLRAKEAALQTKREAFARAGRIGDPSATAEIEAEKAGIVQAQEALATADTELGAANQRLAAAEAERTEIGSRVIDKVTKLEISARNRQEQYANAMIKQNKGLWGAATRTYDIATAAGHGNHEAAKKILKDANKDDMEKAIDQLQAALKKKNEAAKPAATPVAHAPVDTGGHAPATADPHH